MVAHILLCPAWTLVRPRLCVCGLCVCSLYFYECKIWRLLRRSVPNRWAAGQPAQTTLVFTRPAFSDRPVCGITVFVSRAFWSLKHQPYQLQKQNQTSKILHLCAKHCQRQLLREALPWLRHSRGSIILLWYQIKRHHPSFRKTTTRGQILMDGNVTNKVIKSFRPVRSASALHTRTSGPAVVVLLLRLFIKFDGFICSSVNILRGHELMKNKTLTPFCSGEVSVSLSFSPLLSL